MRQALEDVIELANDSNDHLTGCMCEWCRDIRRARRALKEHWRHHGPILLDIARRQGNPRCETDVKAIEAAGMVEVP